LIKEKVENKLIEMIWFGGITDELSNEVIHVTLRLDFENNYPTVKITKG
jgi:hypothetical protein